MRENTKKENNNRRVFARFTGLLIALVMFASSFAAFEGAVKVSAATTTTVTIGEVTISGTVGTPLKEQTFEITVENGKLDPVALYVGKDISDYCTQWDFYSSNRSAIYFFREDSNKDEGSGAREDSLYKIYYYKPLGVKVTVAECTDTKLTCMVSGTPLTPSTSKLYVYLTPEMFAECTQRVDNSCKCLTPDTSGKWNIASKDGSTGAASVSLTCGQNSIEGQAGVTELDTSFTITLKNAIFAKDMEKGTDVSVWFSGIYGQNNFSNNLPVDVAAVLTADVHVGDTSCTAKLTGTPRYGCYNYLAPCIPAQYVIGAGKASAAFWRNKVLCCTSNVEFNIKKLEGEEPFMIANSADVYVYPRNYTADDSTFSGSSSPAAPRVQLELYNGYFSCTNSELTSTIKALENYWLYSNTSGSLDENAVGFLYSAGGTQGAEGHLEIGNFKAAGNSVSGLSSQNKFYIAIKGTPYNVGEYPLSFFVPKNLLADREGEEGYTKVVVDKNESKQGKLVVMKPMQLEVDDALLEYKKGEAVDTYITVKTSVYSTGTMKSESNLNIGNLKYTVSDEFKALGLNMEPVKVTPRSVVFHVTGTIAVKDADFALENAVTLSYENFVYPADSAPERFGEIAINSNPDAKIVVSSGGYGKAGQEIDYSDREPVKIYAVDQKTKAVTGGAIVLSGDTPTLETGVDYKCYSTDGGTKWKDASQKKLTEKQFAALVNKGMEFQIADKYDKSAKGPADDANVYVFEKILKQDKAPKFKIDYETCADATGETTGQFILAVQDGKNINTLTASVIRSEYEIGITDGKKFLEENKYGIWPEKNGVTIAGVENNKVQKTVYFIRTVPVKTGEGWKPAGKAVKISVAGQQKAPNIKLDYKKEVLKAKENMSVTYGENGTALFTKISKDDAKTAVDISGCLEVGVRTEFRIWIAATAKKSASAVQILSAAARAEAVTGSAITFNSGKHTITLDKKYEVYDETKDKWGGLPKMKEEGTYTLLVRRKADAKAGKENDSTYAAGETFKVIVKYGVYDENKSGILEAPVYQLIP